MRTKEWKTTSPSTTQKRRYVYDRTMPYAQLLQEWDNVGNTVMADYLYLDGDLIGFKDERAGSTARYWILKDGQNSVRKVVDTSGSVVASYDYSAFGEVLEASKVQPSGWIFNHRAFGEIQDPNLGMTYLRARWMDPGTGRFESRDPWGGSSFDPQSLHRYTYAHLDPINKMDPSGKFSLIEALAVAVIAHILVLEVLTSDDVYAMKNKAKGAYYDEWLVRFKQYRDRAMRAVDAAISYSNPIEANHLDAEAGFQLQSVMMLMVFNFNAEQAPGEDNCLWHWSSDWPEFDEEDGTIKDPSKALKIYVPDSSLVTEPGQRFCNASATSDDFYYEDVKVAGLVHEGAHALYHESGEGLPRATAEIVKRFIPGA